VETMGEHMNIIEILKILGNIKKPEKQAAIEMIELRPDYFVMKGAK
jgi:hypothetical protein